MTAVDDSSSCSIGRFGCYVTPLHRHGASIVVDMSHCHLHWQISKWLLQPAGMQHQWQSPAYLLRLLYFKSPHTRKNCCSNSIGSQRAHACRLALSCS